MSKRLIRKTEYTEEYILDENDEFPTTDKESGHASEQAESAEQVTEEDDTAKLNPSEGNTDTGDDNSIECCVADADGNIHCGRPLTAEASGEFDE